jgi:hypothetical protein
MFDPGPESPCVKTCVIDPVTGFCIGCGRTGHEIANWLAYSQSERTALKRILPDRLKAITSREARACARRSRERNR